MVEIKLEALVLADDYNYIEYEALSIPYVFEPPVNYVKFYHYTTRAFLDDLEETYGIFYKRIVGYNSSGQPTAGIITAWDDTFLTVLSWTNDKPSFGSTIKLTLIRAKQYVSTAGVLQDVSNHLIEDTLTITQQYESVKKLDLKVSRASFDLVGDTSVKNFINTYWTTGMSNGYYHALAVWIKENGVGKFWGFARPENITYDPDNNVYTIDAYDWLKFLLDTKAQNQLPDYKTINLTTFLEENLVVFNDIDLDVNGMSILWDDDDYNRIVVDGVVNYVGDLMNVEDMIVECIKHYGAYLYYDGNKNLVFKNRRIFNQTVDINDKVIGGEIYQTYKISDYDSLLINVQGEWRLNSLGNYENYSGWALVWYDNGDLQSLVVNADLENIPKGRKYLDLRQRIPFESFDYRLFQSLSREDVLEQYRDILINAKMYEATLVGTNYNLNDKCLFEGSEYMIKNCEIDYGSDSTKVLLERI